MILLSSICSDLLWESINSVALHIREARCPLDVATHSPCKVELAIGWCGEAYSILHYEGNDMCRPLESWAAIIASTKIPPQPEPRAPINDINGPGALILPNYPGGGPEYQHQLVNGNFGNGGLDARGVAVVPAANGTLGRVVNNVIRQRYWAVPAPMTHYQAQAVPVQPAAPTAIGPRQAPSPYTGPALATAPHAGPAQAPRVVQPPQMQSQLQVPQPLSKNLCGSCRQSLVQSLQASRRRI